MAERWWHTVPEIADHVRENLAVGDQTHALRVLTDGINALERIDLVDMDGALDEPTTLGDRRWDLLLAATLRYRLHQMGRTAPRWTLKKPLDKFWFPFCYSTSDAYIAMAHSPAELSRFGIFLDERNFAQA